MTRLIVTGSREWTDRAVVEAALRRLHGEMASDGDEAGLRRLLGAALDDAASLTLTPAARAR